MSKLHRLRPGVFLLSVFLLFVLLVAGHGPPGPVWAAEDDFRDFACWASGDFPDGVNLPDGVELGDPGLSLKPYWGKDFGEDFRAAGVGQVEVNDDEFAVDERDLRGDARLDMNLKADYLKGEHDPPAALPGYPDRPMEKEVYTLFDSLPELVEYAFALDVSGSGPGGDNSISDRRVKRLGLTLGGITNYAIGPGHWPGYPDEDRRYLLPWNTRDEYLDRRRVANPQNAAVRSFYAQWIDLANPQGGRAPDLVALARDDAANRLEALEGTFTAAGDGGVVHYGTMEAVGQEFTFQADEDCGNTGVCNGIVNVSSNPVPVTLHVNIREQNDGQTYRNTTGEGDRRVVVSTSVDNVGVLTKTIETVPFDLREIPPSTLRLRDPSAGGYYRRHQENTGSDQLSVTLVLRNEYRRDLNFDPDSGSLYGERGLPVMGVDPWTYDKIGETRDPDLNEWFRAPVVVDLNLKHGGYRQPELSWAYPRSGELTRENSKHIRWPVNLEDVNWYLYRLPSTGYRDPLWLYWVSKDGRERLVSSAYGDDPVPFPRDGDLGSLLPGDRDLVPDCSLPGDDVNYAASRSGPPLNIETIECEGLGDAWDWQKVWKGERQGVNLPFDSRSASDDHLLGPDLLVKQGVESAVDSWDPVGTRQLNRFEFVIYESERMGDSAVSGKGYDAERRYGIPQNDGKRDEYVRDWAFEEVDPNMPHLLVFTFYEARIDDELVDFKVGDDGSQSQSFSLPKRRVQRVVCRMLVHPSGNGPTDAIKAAISSAFDSIKNFLKEKVEVFKGWITTILKSIVDAPNHLMRKSVEMTCGGMAKLDQLLLDNVPGGSTMVDSEGRIRINEAVQSKAEGFERCHQVSRPPVSTCERDADAVFEGQCLELPEMRLSVRNAEFIRPPADIPYAEFRVRLPGKSGSPSFGERGASSESSTLEGFTPVFLPVDDPLPEPLPSLTGHNVGLTRAFVDWDFRWDTVSQDIHDVIEGYTVYVHPDQKSAPALVPEGGFTFNLPKLVEVAMTNRANPGPPSHQHFRVEGFSVGGLYHYDPGSTFAGPGSDSLVSLLTGSGQDISRKAVGSSRVTAEYENFNMFIHNMPLAPGFVHAFEVRPYVGTPGESTFKQGPLSERLLLRGDSVACDHVSGADVADIQGLYGCGPRSPAAMGYDDDSFRPGLLALTGTDICSDIFSSTPAGFTWDNPVVKQVWWLVWIIAGGVLFTLLVWQGLRMTYDIWLDPQPSTGFRELVPRFLLSVALAAGSLVICRMVLVLASDLTCFVAQYTGMSMWGVIGATFGNLFDGYVAWFLGAFGVKGGPVTILNSFALLMVAGTLVTVVLLFVLFIFLKVMLAMLLRLGLLAVLVAFSPLAFAFYASDATAHWTKKWVSMFLGATFQQVVVLVVIYLGIGLMGDYLESGAEYGLDSMLGGMILAFLTLALADAVPGIVNPQGKGLFSSFSQVMGMAAAGAMVLATAGVGAVAAGVGAGRSAIGGAAAAAPGAAAAGGVPPGGGLISSVSRGPVGPSVSPSGATPSGATPSGVTPSGPVALSTGPSGAPAGAYAGAPTGPAPGAPAGGGGVGGFLSRVGRGAGKGFVQGARVGSRMNTRASDLMGGNSFYSHSSRGDDAAMQAEQRRAEGAGERARTRDSYDRMSDVLSRLENRLQGSGGP